MYVFTNGYFENTCEYIYIYIGFYLLVLVFDTKLSCWKLTHLICLLKLLAFDRQYVK